MSTDIYQVGGDYGNWGAKVVRDEKSVVIRNVAVQYDGTDDDFRSLASLSDGSPKRGIPTESARFIFGGKQWIVGELAYEYNLRAGGATTYGRYGSEEWYALIAASFLKLYGKRSGTIGLTFSLPVSQFRAVTKDQQGNEVRMKDAVMDMLIGQWHLEYEGRPLVYEIVPEMLEMIPEGLGSLAYICLAESGKRFQDRELAQSRVVLFDFGGYTLDILTFDGLNMGPFNESITTGLINARNHVNRELKRRYNRNDMSDFLVDEVIRTGKYKHAGGKPDDVRDIVDAALVSLMKDALRVWQEDLGSGADYDTVIISGGGGPVIGPLLAPQLNHSDVREIAAGEAHLANALGALRRRKFLREMRLAAERQTQAAG